MKSRYKLISLVLAFLLLFTSGVFTQTWAVDLRVGTATGAPGQNVEIPVTVSDNTGIGGAAFTVKFDPNVLTFNGVVPTDFFPGISATLNPPTEYNGETTRYQVNEYTPDPTDGFNYVAVAGARIETDLATGTQLGNQLIILHFIINAGAAEGVSTLQLMQTTLNNVDAGYPAGGEVIPFLTGALPSNDPNFNDPALAFYPIDVVNADNGSVTVTYFIDEDGDGLDDNWEINNFGNITVSDGTGDYDGDNLTNLQEYELGLNPTSGDSDGDGLPDAWEVQYSASCSIDPLANDAAADPDQDGLTNAQELDGGTNPCVYNAPPLQVAGAWLLNFATVKITSTETVASTKQVSFDVVADTGDPNKFSGSFIIDDNNYTLTGVKNDDDSMAYFTLNIPGVGAAKGRGKGHMDTATGINKLEGDFAYSTASVSLEGTFEAYINLPQITGPDPHIVNLNQIYEKFACTDPASDGYGSSNTNYTMTLNTDGTFTGAGADVTTMSGSAADPQISFTIGSKTFAGVILGSELSGVFSDIESATACKTLGSFTASINPLPAGELMIVSPAPEVLPGTSFTLPLLVDSGTIDLAAYDLNLNYDPNVVNFSSVAGGTTANFTTVTDSTIDNTLGDVHIVHYTTATGAKGVSNIAKVTGKATGDPGTKSLLDLTLTDLGDPNFEPIPVTVIDGEMNIGNAKVYLGDPAGYYEISTDDTFIVPVFVENAGDRVIAAYDFTLYYDPEVVVVTEISGGTTPEFSSITDSNLADAAAGSVQWTAFQSNTESPKGAANVSLITFHVPADALDQSKTYLTLYVTDLLDANSKSLAPDVFNNVVTVSAGLCGNVNENRDTQGNERIDIGDALFIAQNLVKKRPFNYPAKWRIANTNGNTRIDIGDALFIAQFLVKKRTSLNCQPVPISSDPTKNPYNTAGY